MGPQISVPDADILIHTGDHTFRGTERETEKALAWLADLPHRHKVLIAGNHDFFFDPNAPKRFRNWSLYRYYSVPQMMAKFPSLTYLQDSGTEIEGLKIWGSPWQPWFYDWAFNFAEGLSGLHQAQATWAKIPEQTQILLTHGPPRGVRDVADDDHPLGCPLLRQRLGSLPDLRVHVFGHIHEGYGITQADRTTFPDLPQERLTFVNAASCTREYMPTNPPLVIDLENLPSP